MKRPEISGSYKQDVRAVLLGLGYMIAISLFWFIVWGSATVLATPLPLIGNAAGVVIFSFVLAWGLKSWIVAEYDNITLQPSWFLEIFWGITGLCLALFPQWWGVAVATSCLGGWCLFLILLQLVVITRFSR